MERLAPFEGRSGAESFYHLVDCKLAGRPCRGTACFVARNSLGQSEPDSVPRIHCFGRCFEAPAVGLSRRRPSVTVDAPEAVVLGRLCAGGARTLKAYCEQGGYSALARAFSDSPFRLIEALEFSALRGRGGAGFLTGRKWRAAAAQPEGEKHIVANADEGDSGAYIDRFLLEDDPFALIEGMTIAGFAIRARHGWIYLRREYPFAKKVLRNALAEARAAGLLGGRIHGSRFAFDIEIVEGKGGYVCGEETCLLRSMEGRRPEAAARPPFLTEKGLFGAPTVVNNVETLVTVPWIVERGATAFHALGFSKSRGTKVVSLNSLFVRPGLYEVEFGTTVRKIAEELGGGLRTGPIKGLLIGGPLGGVVPTHLFDTRLGFEELREIGASLGHGGIIGFDAGTSLVGLLHHVFSFAAYESCGKCAPCRLGASRLEEIFHHLQAGAANRKNTEIREIISLLKSASLCGHGIGVAEIAESVLRHYGKELEPWLG